MNSRLRLGPLPKTDVFRIAIVVHADLKADLDAYLQAYCETWREQADLPSLITHMLRSFVERDRAFQKIRRNRTA
jgi:hypothetical protein